MQRKQLLEDFLQTMEVQIDLQEATYDIIGEGMSVRWSTDLMAFAWITWLAAYETYACVSESLIGCYE